MINPFKLLYRSGRQDVVSGIWDEVVTEERVSAVLSDGLTKAVAESGLPLDKAIAVAECTGKATDVVGELFKAAEDGVITQDEARMLLGKAFAMFGTTLAETLSAVKSKVIERIP